MNQSEEVVKSEPGVVSEALQVTINMDLTVPLMHPKKFAASIGLSLGVIGGWIDQPTFRTPVTWSWHINEHNAHQAD